MLALAVLGEGPARRIEEGREHNAPLPSDLKKEELYLFKMFKIFILCVSEHFENLLNKPSGANCNLFLLLKSLNL